MARDMPHELPAYLSTTIHIYSRLDTIATTNRPAATRHCDEVRARAGVCARVCVCARHNTNICAAAAVKPKVYGGPTQVRRHKPNQTDSVGLVSSAEAQ